MTEGSKTPRGYNNITNAINRFTYNSAIHSRKSKPKQRSTIAQSAIECGKKRNVHQWRSIEVVQIFVEIYQTEIYLENAKQLFIDTSLDALPFTQSL